MNSHRAFRLQDSLQALKSQVPLHARVIFCSSWHVSLLRVISTQRGSNQLVGLTDGSAVGVSVGCEIVGVVVGQSVGCLLGKAVGADTDGDDVGKDKVGLKVGWLVGTTILRTVYPYEDSGRTSQLP